MSAKTTVILGGGRWNSIDGLQTLMSGGDPTTPATGGKVIIAACGAILLTWFIVAKGPTSIKFFNMIVAPALLASSAMNGAIQEATYNFFFKLNYNKTFASILSTPLSPGDIAMGVDREKPEEQGAGDQGLMFGYASNETDSLMPAPICYAHRLVERQAEVRKSHLLPWLRPDAKSQVTCRYVDGKVVGLDAVVLSTQHDPEVKQSDLQEAVMELIIKHVLPKEWLTKQTRFHINPTGKFEIGGPVGDCGLTGRKIIVDTYGGMARHGGGAFSGKDPSKVDRSAAYAARWVAKNVVAAGIAERCEVQVAYAIGVAHPVSLMVETFGTSQVDPDKISAAVSEVFDLRPAAIIRDLELRQPMYRATAAYGHFGRSSTDGFTWERTDRVDQLKSALGL